MSDFRLELDESSGEAMAGMGRSDFSFSGRAG